MTDPLHIDVPLWGWVAFNVYVVVLLLVDLLLFNRKAHKIEWREAAWLSAFFVVAFHRGRKALLLAEGAAAGASHAVTCRR